MNAKSNHEDPRDSNKWDDLTAIANIKQTRQDWFRQTLNVHTYRDLAALSVDEIDSRLKVDGKIASRTMIQGWIEKAKELATASQRSAQTSGTTALIPTAKAKPTASPAEWNSIANFFVQLQTRQGDNEKIEQRIMVRHIPVAENGTWLEEDPQKEPYEIEDEHQGEQLYEWMQAQVSDELEHRENVPLQIVETTAHKAIPVTLKITQIRIFQPPQTLVPIGIGEADKIFKGSIRGNESFNVEVSVVLSDIPTSDAEITDTQYKVQCYAYNRSTGEHINLGETKPKHLFKNRLVYMTTLTEVRLAPGYYLFQVIAELLGPLRAFGFSELPMLQVIDISVPHPAQAVVAQI